MKVSIKTFFIFTLFVMLLLAGCSGSSTTTTVVQGSSPVIRSLSVQGLPAAPGSLITTTVIAQSAQNLALTYTWTATSPWSVSPSSVNSQTATITAPDGYAITGTATVEVSDTYGRYALVPIPLSTVGNIAPVITSFSASPNPVTPGGLMAIAVTASDPDGDTPSYTWQASQGWTIATGKGTSTITVTAPTQYGVSGTVTVTVDDGHGDAVNLSLPVSTYLEFLPSITVSPQPVITSTTLTCNGYYPLDNALTFNWTVDGLPVTTGNPGVWYSPGLPGTYVVGVTVEDGKAGIATSTTPIQVNSTSPWPMLHGNIQLTGQSPIDTSSITNTTTWITSTITPGAVSTSWGTGAPVIGADGTIYIGNSEVINSITNTGYLYALRPTNGTVEWSYQTGPMISPPVVGADGTIYAGSLMPYTSSGSIIAIYALSPAGNLKWSDPFSMRIVYPPTIGADGTIYVAISTTGNSSLYALNPTDGSVKWSTSIGLIPGNPGTPPAIGPDGTIYTMGSITPFGTLYYCLYALNPTDGSVKWTFLAPGGRTFSDFSPEPAVGTDGTIYLASMQSFYAINPNGSSKWTFDSQYMLSTTPVIGSNGTIIAGGAYGLQALSITNGTPKWSYSSCSGCSVTSQLASGADGTIYVGSDAYPDNIFALTPTGGLKWSYSTNTNNPPVYGSPAIGMDGTESTVYFGDVLGNVFAFH
ncbi:MAG: PQQ-binding-like beta-propeller repeat protein [Deltaproteobacteria bacterium]|nr:PQQ-binding-like beta-propeller repeat protein [Deltaproteobacteria bacterium]MCL5277197.1 PQQ-binding-like beta-propeller repeat protein [Deltaproteobacteria bacterium]